MGKIALLAPWLQRIFPPAETPGFQPLETSGDISYVHQVFHGSDDLGEAEETASVGAAGGKRIDIVQATDDFYIIIHASQITHDDVARVGTFELGRGIVNVALGEGIRVNINTGIVFSIGRTIFVPPGWNFGFGLQTIAAGKIITGLAVFTRVPIGHPHQNV